MLDMSRENSAWHNARYFRKYTCITTRTSHVTDTTPRHRQRRGHSTHDWSVRLRGQSDTIRYVHIRQHLTGCCTHHRPHGTTRRDTDHIRQSIQPRRARSTIHPQRASITQIGTSRSTTTLDGQTHNLAFATLVTHRAARGDGDGDRDGDEGGDEGGERGDERVGRRLEFARRPANNNRQEHVQAVSGW